MKNLTQHPINSVTRGGGALAALTLLVGLLLWSIQAQAAGTIEEYNLDENQTLDTTTGLLWYDIDASVNLSWNQMEANFLDSSSVFFGFRHATKAELFAFWENAGLGTAPVSGVGYFDGVLQTAFDEYVALTGTTLVSDGLRAQIAYLDNFLLRGQVNDTTSFEGLTTNDLDGAFYTGDTAIPSVGHYIVRQAPSVPSPSMFLLTGFGLMGIVGLRIKNR